MKFLQIQNLNFLVVCLLPLKIVPNHKKQLQRSQIIPSQLDLKSFSPTVKKISNFKPNKKLCALYKTKKKNLENFDSNDQSFNLLNLIKILMKAANLFRFRTKFRGVRFINERQIGLIDDICYFPQKNQKKIYLKQYTEKNVIFFSN